MKQVVCSVCGGTEGISPVFQAGWGGVVFCTTCAAASKTATGEALKHDPDCLGHSECSCALPRFKARVAALLKRVEWVRGDLGGYGACPECKLLRGLEWQHAPDCELAALLKGCESA